MARFVLPVFNLPVNIWRFGGGPPGAPAVSTFGNLSPGKVTGILLATTTSAMAQEGAMWLRLPPATDIRDLKDPAGPDRVEVPAGSGRMYDVGWVDDIGAGFANEHRFASIIGKSPWPLPFPSGGAGPPPPPVMNFYGGGSKSSGGAAVNQLFNLFAPLINATDRGYLAVQFLDKTGPIFGATCDGVPATLLVNTAAGPFLGHFCDLAIFESHAHAGAGQWAVSLNPPFVAQIAAIAANLTNPPIATVGTAGNAGLFPAPPSITMFGGEVLVVGTPSMCAFSVMEVPSAGFAVNGPFVELQAGQLNILGAEDAWLNFGTYSNPPVGPLTGSENIPVTNCVWNAAILGKH